ncbi:MAG: glycine cleavage system aminomethyltransferase GcvT [Gammaproteobacteria bacterium]|nr:glycine cleavage system aminomethyltransferase GcvT [Gammaproteobacteria bacterium]
MIVETALHQEHLALGATMVDFHGWHLPLHYGSQLEEHKKVRTQAGLFDVSHMTIVDILGAGGRQFLRTVLTHDIDKLPHVGRALYSCMCNRFGGIIDDLIVYQRSPDNYRLILNAATKQRDLEWLHQNIQGYAADIQERNDLIMIAVQGPKAIETTMQVLSASQTDALSTIAPFECVEPDHLFIARTGYTGEDGLEIIASPADITQIWQALIAKGVSPCGLAARDTLRIEAGLLLYGQDMDESTTPLESSLAWTVTWEPNDRDFIGRGTLLSQKQHGLEQKLVGITLQDKGILRAGQKIMTDGLGEGIVTSGTFSPTLNQSIGFARVPLAAKDNVWVEIRDKRCLAQMGKLRFINKGK